MCWWTAVMCQTDGRSVRDFVACRTLNHEAALRLGGWDPRYAVLLATDARDGVAAALVDTNGDGADIDIDQYQQRADGVWVELSSGNCGETGALWTGVMGVVWGCTDPRVVVPGERTG